MDKWIDIKKASQRIKKLFSDYGKTIEHFGSTINQVFEAFTFCAVVKWYERHGWSVQIHNPEDPKTKQPLRFIRLKFSTRGCPANYSYASCTKKDDEDPIEVRHQLRVATNSYKNDGYPMANICLDVAIIKAGIADIGYLHTDDHIPNSMLISFGEAKHMSAYAELLAGFLGMVHELQPKRLMCVRRGQWDMSHVAPFLYVSGHLYSTAKGILKTIRRRKYDVDVYCDTAELVQGFKLPTKVPPKSRTTTDEKIGGV